MRYFQVIFRNLQVDIQAIYSKTLIKGPLHVSYSFRNYAAKKVPKGERRFSENHTWVYFQGKLGTVGISNYAQEQMGEFVFVQLPRINTFVVKDEPCGTLESFKAVCDLRSPVSGEVYEKNNVEDNLHLINESCYDKGWLFKIDMNKTEELRGLMNEAEYDEFVKNLHIEGNKK